MTEIIVYPNNDVTINGQWTIWTDKEFRQYRIPMIRPARLPWANLIVGREALTIEMDHTRLIVFPTVSFIGHVPIQVIRREHLKRRQKIWKPIGSL